MGSSRLPGFYKMKIAERLRRLADQLELPSGELESLGESATLPLPNADAMIENAVGVLGLPVGLGLNFVINGEDLWCPWRWRSPRSSPRCRWPRRSRARAAGSRRKRRRPG